MHFLEQLTTCLGDYKNMQFNVDLISVGNDYTAAVNWHIGIISSLSALIFIEQTFLGTYYDEETFNLIADWKRIQVPFTRGCSYFSLSENDDKLVIKYEERRISLYFTSIIII